MQYHDWELVRARHAEQFRKEAESSDMSVWCRAWENRIWACVKLGVLTFALSKTNLGPSP